MGEFADEAVMNGRMSEIGDNIENNKSEAIAWFNILYALALQENEKKNKEV